MALPRTPICSKHVPDRQVDSVVVIHVSATANRSSFPLSLLMLRVPIANDEDSVLSPNWLASLTQPLDAGPCLHSACV